MITLFRISLKSEIMLIIMMKISSSATNRTFRIIKLFSRVRLGSKLFSTRLTKKLLVTIFIFSIMIKSFRKTMRINNRIFLRIVSNYSFPLGGYYYTLKLRSSSRKF